MASKSDLTIGINHIDASEDSDGVYVYRDTATNHWYRVSAADVAFLGQLVRRDEDDAYSQWCACTAAVDLGEDYACDEAA